MAKQGSGHTGQKAQCSGPCLSRDMSHVAALAKHHHTSFCEMGRRGHSAEGEGIILTFERRAEAASITNDAPKQTLPVAASITETSNESQHHCKLRPDGTHEQAETSIEFRHHCKLRPDGIPN